VLILLLEERLASYGSYIGANKKKELWLVAEQPACSTSLATICSDPHAVSYDAFQK
jgi:hypothetical protein